MLSHTEYQSGKRRAALAKSITIRKIPDALYDRLVAAAKSHRRSLEDEAMAGLDRDHSAVAIASSGHLLRNSLQLFHLQGGKPMPQAIAQRAGLVDGPGAILAGFGVALARI